MKVNGQEKLREMLLFLYEQFRDHRGWGDIEMVWDNTWT